MKSREEYIMDAFLFARYGGNVTYKIMNIANLLGKISKEVDSAMKVLKLDPVRHVLVPAEFPAVSKRGRPKKKFSMPVNDPSPSTQA